MQVVQQLEIQVGVSPHGHGDKKPLLVTLCSGCSPQERVTGLGTVTTHLGTGFRHPSQTGVLQPSGNQCPKLFHSHPKVSLWVKGDAADVEGRRICPHMGCATSLGATGLLGNQVTYFGGCVWFWEPNFGALFLARQFFK